MSYCTVLGVGLEEANFTANEADSIAYLRAVILSGSLEMDILSVTYSTSSQPGDTASPGNQVLMIISDVGGRTKSNSS